MKETGNASVETGSQKRRVEGGAANSRIVVLSDILFSVVDSMAVTKAVKSLFKIAFRKLTTSENISSEGQQ